MARHATHAAPSGAQWTIAVRRPRGRRRRGRRRAADLPASTGSTSSTGTPRTSSAPARAGQVLAPWPNRIRDGRYTFGGAVAPARAHRAGPAQRHPRPGQLGRAGGWSTQPPDAVTVELRPAAAARLPVAAAAAHHAGRVGAGRAARRRTRRPTSAARPCPFGFAVHPYLRLPGVAVDDLTLRVPARSRLLVDGRLLPIGAARVAGTEYDFTEPRRIGDAVLDTGLRRPGPRRRRRLVGDARRAGRPAGVTVWADARVRLVAGVHRRHPRRRAAPPLGRGRADDLPAGRVPVRPGPDHPRARADLARHLGHPARRLSERDRGMEFARGGPAAPDGAQLRPGPAGAARGGATGCSTTRSGRRRPASPRAGGSWCWRRRPTGTGSGRRPRPDGGGRERVAGRACAGRR